MNDYFNNLNTMKETLKKCTKCGRELPITEFYKNKATNDGYCYWCKDCMKLNKEKYDTPITRARHLISCYLRADRKYLRGVCNLKPEWIVENIFSQPCAHCGKTGWKIIGCNRLDNSLPHTPDNVEPCCLKCNLKLEGKEVGNKFSSQFNRT